MLAFTTECSVVTTDGTNALQRVLEHVNYHVVTVKLSSPFLLKCYFITAVCLCTCNMCGTALHAAVCTRRSEGSLWESMPPLCVQRGIWGSHSCLQGWQQGASTFLRGAFLLASVSNYNWPPSL